MLPLRQLPNIYMYPIPFDFYNLRRKGIIILPLNIQNWGFEELDEIQDYT